MKNIKYIFSFFSILIFSFATISCSKNISNTTSLIKGEDNCQNCPKELSFKDYFKNWNSSLNVSKEENQIKKEITSTINNYRLYEWNNWYENKSSSKLERSNVLNIKYSSYNLKPDVVGNDLLKEYKDKIEWTAIYKEQDDQFRYFNDFINIFSNNDENLEDFLYLRWEYYSLFAAKKYNEIYFNGKHIYEINLEDWTTAIDVFIETIGVDFEQLEELIKAFLNYYGINVDIINGSFFKMLLSDSFQYESIDIKMVDKCIFQTMLCAKDMVMRCSSKLEEDINRYPLWKRKIERIIKMYDLTKEKYDLLPNSFLTGKNNISENDENKNKLLNLLKTKLMKLIETVAKPLVSIDLKEYSNENDINKGGCCV